MNISDNLIKWLANGERGISSNTIVAHLGGVDTLGGHASIHPLDPDDLCRCRLLLEQCPELLPLMPRMKNVSPQWAALVDHWTELCALMDDELPDWRENGGMAKKTYKRMDELIRGAE